MPAQIIRYVTEKVREKVIDWKVDLAAEGVVAWHVKSENFKLPPPHQDKEVHFLVGNHAAHGICAVVKFQSCPSRKSIKGTALILNDFRLKLQLVQDGQQVLELDIKIYRGSFGQLEWLTANLWKYRAMDQSITIRLTVIDARYKNPPKVFNESDGERMSVLQSLAALRKSEPQKSVTMRVGDQSVRLLKLVVDYRSPVLMAMLEAEQADDAALVVDIADIDFAAVDAFGKFLYTGAISFSSMPMALHVARLAHTYRVSTLLEFATAYIKHMLDEDVGASALEYALNHALTELHQDLFLFMWKLQMK